MKQQPFSLLTVYNVLAVDLGASVSPSDIRPSLQVILGTESRLVRPAVLSVKEGFWVSSFLWDRGGVGITLGSLSSLF